MMHVQKDGKTVKTAEFTAEFMSKYPKTPSDRSNIPSDTTPLNNLKRVRVSESSTKYTGLYTVRLKNGDTSFIGRWKIDGRNYRASLGKESDGMTLESAYAHRLTLMEKGVSDSKRKSKHSSTSKIPAESYLTLAKVFRKYLIFKKKMNGKPLKSEEWLTISFNANYKKIKNKRIEQITEEDIRKVRYELLAKGRATKTIYLYITHLRTLFFFARDELKLKPQEID